MSKTFKIIITAIVLSVPIFYFIFVFKSNPLVKNTSCLNFNSKLLLRAEQYFLNELPKNAGETLSVSVNELIANGLLMLEDLEKVGTSCSGNVYVTSDGIQNYYYTDVTCGSCSTSDLYTAWSDWTDTLPFNTLDLQSQVSIYYNYGTGIQKYSDWSEWGLNLESIVKPTISNEVEIINTEQEEKTQYSYRNGSFKWYKASSIESYYNNGAYYEKQPSSGYLKDANSQTQSRKSDLYTSNTELKNTLSGLSYSIKSVSAYQVPATYVTKYIYLKEQNTSECASAKYTCTYDAYKCCSTKCTSKSIYESPSYYSTSEQAVDACNLENNVANCNASIYKNFDGKTIYYLTFTFASPQYTCMIDNCAILTDSYTDCILNINESATTSLSAQNCFINGGIETSSCSNGVTLKFEDGEYCFGNSCYNKRKLSLNSCSLGKYYKYTFNTVLSKVGQANCGDDYTEETLECMNNFYLKNDTCPTGKGLVNSEETRSKEVSKCGSECNSCQFKTCQEYKKKTIYLKKDGTTTENKNEAGYFSKTEYNSLNVSGFTTGDSKQEPATWGSLKSGSCSSTTNCKNVSAYQATIYKFKWYKEIENDKEWYNNGEYLDKSPGNGWIADSSTAKWDEWSDYNDTPITKSTTKDVRTQALKRIRYSYIDSSKLVLEEWLPLSEFEKLLGKSLEEVENDKAYSVFKKNMYKYRVLQSN